MEPKSEDLWNGRSSSSREDLETGSGPESASASGPATRDEPVDEVKPTSTPPDGGWQAWMAGRQIAHDGILSVLTAWLLAVLSCFLTIMNTWFVVLNHIDLFALS